MNMKENFRKECVGIISGKPDKKTVLTEIATLASKSKVLDSYSKDVLFNAFFDRENLCSTGFEHGIAIPHCRLKEVSEFVIGLLLLPDGVDFESADGTPTHFCFFVVGPEKHRSEHIRVLSTISKRFDKEDLRNNLLAFSDPQALYSEASKYFPDSSLENDEKSLLTFFVQNDELFDEILKALPSSATAVVVTEGDDLSRHFYKLPLFSTFWNDEGESKRVRVVRAIVSQRIVNEIVRETDVLKNSLGIEDGCVTTVQNLTYVSGQLLS